MLDQIDGDSNYVDDELPIRIYRTETHLSIQVPLTSKFYHSFTNRPWCPVICQKIAIKAYESKATCPPRTPKPPNRAAKRTLLRYKELSPWCQKRWAASLRWEPSNVLAILAGPFFVGEVNTLTLPQSRVKSIRLA